MAEVVNGITDALGYDPESEPDSDEEVTRQADLARLRALADGVPAAHDDGDVAAFVDELGRRFSTEHSGRGVNLLTYHRAKGLEFDAVFLPRLLDGELPFRSRPREGRAGRGAPAALRRHHAGAALPVPLVAADAKTKPSPFLDELGVGRRRRRSEPRRAHPPAEGRAGGPVRCSTG